MIPSCTTALNCDDNVKKVTAVMRKWPQQDVEGRGVDLPGICKSAHKEADVILSSVKQMD